MSHGDPTSSWDPRRPDAPRSADDGDRSESAFPSDFTSSYPLPPPAGEAWAAIHPTERGDSIVATWGLLAFGHAVEGCFGVWALIWGGLPQRYDDPAPAIVAVVVITILGWTGTAVTLRMLRTALDARQALDSGRPPADAWPPPIVTTSLFVILALSVGVLAGFGWQAIGVFPAVAIELMLIPLAVRTERLLRDAREGAVR